MTVTLRTWFVLLALGVAAWTALLVAIARALG
jgi:hypothetical protein